MNSKPHFLKRKYRHFIVRTIVFFSLMLGGTAAHAQEIKAWEILLLAELPVVLFSGVASQSPELAGATLLGMSAFSYDRYHNTIGNALSIGSMVSLGLMNSLELKKSRYSKTDVFLGNVVGINAKYLLEFMVLDDAFRRDMTSGLELRIHPDNYFVGYRFQF